jgi:predicted AAA+ superfamily ATPase
MRKVLIPVGSGSGRHALGDNLNWFVDGNTAVEVALVPQRDVVRSDRVRTMRANVSEAGITRLEIGRPDDLASAGYGISRLPDGLR